MPDSKSINITRFLHQYKGIEGFYFLNRQGELGYINEDTQRTVKEVYPQVNDKNFLRLHPNFMSQIEGFLRAIDQIPKAYHTAKDVELGYILPVSDNYPWHSATLVLHKEVVATLQRDDKAMYSRGLKDPFQSDRDAEKMRGVRSIQQGFDDLLHHRDVFGVYKYFPVLFKLPENGNPGALSSEKSTLRVLNLKWRDTGATPVQAADYLAYQTVFSVLRANLTKRGAIARHKRLQHRYAVS